jgi:hypothetical protein
MKKRLLLVLVLVSCLISISAQEKLQTTVQTPSIRTIENKMFKANFSNIKGIAAPVISEIGDKNEFVKAPQADVSYAKPAGTYHGTFHFQEGTQGLTAFYPLIHGKAFYDWKFVASGGSNYTWAVGTAPLEADASGNGIYNRSCGSYSLPTVTSGTQSYIWHQAVGAQFASISDGLYYLSMVDVWKNSGADGFNNLNYFNGYGYGSGKSSENSPFFACFQIYDKPQAPIYIESVNAAIYSSNNNPLPGDNYLTCIIYPVRDNGNVDWDNPIAESNKCSSGHLEDWGNLTSTMKLFNAPFYFSDLDPGTGIYGPKNLSISTSFAIFIQWSSGADLGFIWGDSDGDGNGSAVFAEDGKGYTYAYSGPNGERMPVDLYINIKGSMTNLSVDERITSISFPVEGGSSQVSYTGEGNYPNIIFDSTFSLESNNVSIDEDELPDWVKLEDASDQTVTLDGTVYFAYAVDFVFSATPLPAGLPGRAANIKVKSLGVERILTIKQGVVTSISTPQSVGEPAKAVRQGNDFVLSYPASATSVSVYNVTGQQMGEYKLNTNGKYTLPVADLANGIYILKFNGTNSVVKIIK